MGINPDTRWDEIGVTEIKAVFSFKRTIYPLIWPLIILVFSVLTLWKWPFLTKIAKDTSEIKAILVILPWLPYVIISIIMMMAWRYNNTGLIFTAVLLAFSYFIVSQYGSTTIQQKYTALRLGETTVFLFPLNLTLFSMLTKRRLLTTPFLVCILLVGFQIIAVLLFCRWPNSSHSPLWVIIHKTLPLVSAKISSGSVWLGSWLHNGEPITFKHISLPALIAFGGSLLFLLGRFLITHDTIQAGFLGTLLAAFLGITAHPPLPEAMIYFTAAGIILIITTFESSYHLAYIDELTGLQGRRSLNETLINLGQKYAIAMIDVDHFKKFNDTYGHKTGDQVLRMIAAEMAKMGGGAKTFRYGGDEFAAIFPGKSAEEARPYLEKYSGIVAATPFIVRSKPRRKSNAKNRGKNKASGQKQVTVTVSIGAAAPHKNLTKPEGVLKAADQTLYKAKKAGRNRVMIQNTSI